MNSTTPSTNGSGGGGWFRVENIAADRLVRLSGVAVKVYLSLCQRARNESRECWASLGTIVKDTGSGRGGVVAALKELSTAGLVTVLSHDGVVGRGGPSNRYRIATGSEIELVPFQNRSGSKTEPKLVLKQNPNYTNRTKRKNQTKSSRRALRFDEGDLATAKWMFSKIQDLGGNPKEPSFEKWANTIRLMREGDKRTDEEIRAVFTWANQDGFWKSNILSPDKLREKWQTLNLKMKGSRNGHDGKPKHDPVAAGRCT